MPELDFAVVSAEPHRFAAEPILLFKLNLNEVAQEGQFTNIHSVILRCQVRIEPARRQYSPAEKERLLDLFGTPERWGQTLRPMLWTHVVATVPSFTGLKTVELAVPCSSDFTLAAVKYFGALEQGNIPLCFLFSGTIFFEGPDGAFQVEQISWTKEAVFSLEVDTWQLLMNLHYPNTAWMSLRKDVFEALARYKRRQGLPTLEHAVERLLSGAEEVVAP